MSDNLKLIEILNVCFYFTLIVSIVFLALAVVFFFVFKIPQIYMMKTGKARRKTVEKMQSVNSQTGRLKGSSGATQISGIFGNSSELDSQNITTEIGGQNSGQSFYQPETQAAETSVLSAAEMVPNQAFGRFEILQNVMEIHTNEIIA